MFGYVMINKGDLKVREFETYQSFYCGLCRKLKVRYGLSGQLTLSYDLTFVVLLLTGLYEPKVKKGTTHCIIHPLKKQPIQVDVFSDYAADMSILLNYYKCMDDWSDEQKIDRRLLAELLKKKFGGLEASYFGKAEKVKVLLDRLFKGEAENSPDIDYMAGIFGEIMAEILVWREDEWKENLRRMGFFLGKFIYLCDAYEDLEEDLAEGHYNPLARFSGEKDFEENCRGILTMMAAECSREFEKLPIIEYTGILRNILYSGIWTRYEKTRKKRAEEKSDINKKMIRKRRSL